MASSNNSDLSDSARLRGFSPGSFKVIFISRLDFGVHNFILYLCLILLVCPLGHFPDLYA